MMLYKIVNSPQVLTEQTISLEFDNMIKPLMVIKNPSDRDTVRMLMNSKTTSHNPYHELRGLIDLDRDQLYIWDSYIIVHYQVANELGIQMYNEIVITEKIPPNKMKSVSMDHSASTVFVGGRFIAFTRDIPNLRMFNSFGRIFAADDKVTKIHLD